MCENTTTNVQDEAKVRSFHEWKNVSECPRLHARHETSYFRGW